MNFYCILIEAPDALLLTPLMVTHPGLAPLVPGRMNSAEFPMRYTTIPLDFHPTVAEAMETLAKEFPDPKFFEIKRGRFPSSEVVSGLL